MQGCYLPIYPLRPLETVTALLRKEALTIGTKQIATCFMMAHTRLLPLDFIGHDVDGFAQIII